MLYFSRNNTQWLLLITIMWWIHLRKKSIRVENASQLAEKTQFLWERNCSVTETEILHLKSSAADAVLHWSWECQASESVLRSCIWCGFIDIFFNYCKHNLQKSLEVLNLSHMLLYCAGCNMIWINVQNTETQLHDSLTLKVRGFLRDSLSYCLPNKYRNFKTLMRILTKNTEMRKYAKSVRVWKWCK